MKTRRGFTLVELLVVITVLGLLVALLVPAVMSAMRRGRQAQAEAQVNTLAAALASFNAKFGMYPPSRLVFHESGYLGTPPNGSLYFSGFNHAVAQPAVGGHPDGPAEGSPEHRELVERSVRALRSLFPKLNLSPAAVTPTSPMLAPIGQFYDINGNGDLDAEPILLEGHECLFLFLCGMADWEGDQMSPPGMTLRGVGGFNVNPRNPFVRVPASGPDQTRTEPYYEVASPARLLDDDGDGVPGLLDPIGAYTDARYVAYFAPHSGRYDPRDVQFEPSSPCEFFVPGLGTIVAAGPNPWATSETNAPPNAPRWHRPQSFQLVSPGPDRAYGPGGRVAEVAGGISYPQVPGGPSRAAEEDNAALR